MVCRQSKTRDCRDSVDTEGSTTALQQNRISLALCNVKQHLQVISFLQIQILEGLSNNKKSQFNPLC